MTHDTNEGDDVNDTEMMKRLEEEAAKLGLPVEQYSDALWSYDEEFEDAVANYLKATKDKPPEVMARDIEVIRPMNVTKLPEDKVRAICASWDACAVVLEAIKAVQNQLVVVPRAADQLVGLAY